MLLTCHCRSKPGVMANTFTPAIKFNGKCSFYERLNWLNSLVNIHSAFFCARSFPCSKINHGALKSRSAHSTRFSAKLSTRNLIMCSPKWGITYPVMLKSGAKAWTTASCWDKSFPLLFSTISLLMLCSNFSLIEFHAPQLKVHRRFKLACCSCALALICHVCLSHLRWHVINNMFALHAVLCLPRCGERCQEFFCCLRRLCNTLTRWRKRLVSMLSMQDDLNILIEKRFPHEESCVEMNRRIKLFPSLPPGAVDDETMCFDGCRTRNFMRINN